MKKCCIAPVCSDYLAPMSSERINLGYDDTPFLPGQAWRVHDSSRPQPRAVTPGAAGTHGPPSDAVVLFDGTDLSQWESCNGGDAPWKVVGGFYGSAGTFLLG